MADVVSDVDILEQRIAELETKVYGNLEKDADYPRIIDNLMEIQNKMNSALTGKKKAAQLYAKLPELNNYLDPACVDNLLLSDDARADTVIAASTFLEKNASLLEQLSDNQKHVNTEHIQEVPQLSEKLHTLSQVQISQQDEVAGMTENARLLLNAYNSVVSSLSKQFISWDETLTQMEARAKK